jgi:hypothetical protein
MRTDDLGSSALLGLAMIIGACSRAPKERSLFDDPLEPFNKNVVTACHRDSSPPTHADWESAVPDRPLIRRMLCDLMGERHVTVGQGVIVLRRSEAGLGVCGLHLLPTPVRGPISFETIFPVDDPILAFALRGLAAGIDSHREFHRVVDIDGVHVDLEQFVPDYTNTAYVELEINACKAAPDGRLVVTNGKEIFGH